MVSQMMNRVVVNFFLLVLASQWAASHAGRLMAAKTQSATEFGDGDQMPRFAKERKLAYDYSRDSVDAPWNAETFSSDTSFTSQEGETNDGEVIYIDSPETVVESALADDQTSFYQSDTAFSYPDPNADEVYFDTSSADTVYSASEMDS